MVILRGVFGLHQRRKAMKTYDKIVFASEKDIQDRDKAIIELYDALKLHIKDHPVAKKYEEFVAKTRILYGM